MAGVKFWCYTAGHVLGAAMFMIEIAGVKVFELAHEVTLLFVLHKLILQTRMRSSPVGLDV